MQREDIIYEQEEQELRELEKLLDAAEEKLLDVSEEKRNLQQGGIIEARESINQLRENRQRMMKSHLSKATQNDMVTFNFGGSLSPFAF